MIRLRQSSVLFLLVTCFIALSVPNTAQAGIVVYSDPTAFASQMASGACAQDFTGLSGSLGNNVPFCGPPPNNTFSYSAFAPSGLYGAGGLSTQASDETLLLSFTGPLFPTAVGGYFFSDDLGPLTVGVSIDGGANFFTVAFADTSLTPFVGFMDYGGPAFTNLEVFSGGAGFPTIQSLNVGAIVPEPGTLGLLGGALVGLGLLAKKRRH